MASTATSIEWTDATWNPTVGCDRISPGCAKCYAKELHDRRHKAFLAGKDMAPQYAKPFEALQLMDDRLDAPLHWRKPRRIFVNSMSDLFHEDVPDEFIDRVFAVMALAPQHTFQILTKRADRMRKYFDGIGIRQELIGIEAERISGFDRYDVSGIGARWKLPLPNVWLGVSVENQYFADERIPLLLHTPAAVRFISAEPLLGPVNLEPYLKKSRTIHVCADVEGMLANKSFDGLSDNGKPLSRSEAESGMRTLVARGVKRIQMSDECVGFSDQTGCPGHQHPRLDWVIVGGESGPQSRPFDLAWARSIVQQCQDAGVPVFVKQIGAKPYASVSPDWSWNPTSVKDRKGGDPSEWPEDLRIRQFPETRA